jgi:hypothetical protein
MGYQKNWDTYRQALAAQQIADVGAMTAAPTLQSLGAACTGRATLIRPLDPVESADRTGALHASQTGKLRLTCQ